MKASPNTTSKIFAPGLCLAVMVALSAASTFADTSTWTGATNGNWDNTTLNWSNASGSIFTNEDTVIFNDTLGANFGITVQEGGVAPASILFADNGVGSNAYIFSGGGIGGSGSLTVGGGFDGTVTLNTFNSYTGGTTVNAGILNLSAGGWAGAVRGVLTINAGATVRGTVDDALGWGDPGARVTVVNVNGGIFESTSTGNQGLSQTWNLTGGTLRSNNGVATGWSDWGVGRIVFGAGAVVETLASSASSVLEGQFFLNPDNGHETQTFTVADGAAESDLLVTGNITTAYGTVGIIKDGAGTMTLAAINTFNGGTTVNAGTLNLSAGGWAGAVRGELTIQAGATVRGTVDDALGWGDPGARVTVVNVNGGIFESTSTGNQGLSQTWKLTGGTLRSNNGVATGWSDWGVGRIVFGAGAVVETLASSASSVLEGQFFLNPDNGHETQTFTVADGAAESDLLVTGNITTAYGTVGIIKDGAGTMTLAAVNTFNGGTTVNAGTLNLSAGGWAGAVRGELTIHAGATVKGTVDDALGWGDPGARVTVVNLNGGTFESTSTGNQGLSQTWKLTGGTLRSNNGVATEFADFGAGRIVLGPGTVVETFASAASSAIEGQIFLRPGDGHANQTFTVADGAAATDLLVSASIGTEFGTMGITKAGAGTMTVSGVNTFNGETQINAGTLVANNTGTTSATGTGTVTVNTGATLAGTGRIAPAAGNSVFINGFLQVGDPTLGTPGAAGFEIVTTGSGSTVFGATSELHIDLITGAGLGDNIGVVSSADRLLIAGDLTIASGAKLTVANPNAMTSWAIGDIWHILDWSDLGTRTGTFDTAAISLPGLSGDLAWDTADLFSNGTISIVASVAPEPGRASLLVIACAACVLHRRRRGAPTRPYGLPA